MPSTPPRILPLTYKLVLAFSFAAILSMSAPPPFACGQFVVPKPHEKSEDGFYVDKNQKILLRVPEGMKDDGYRIKNLSIIGERIDDLEIAGLQKVYFKSQGTRVVAKVVVSDKNIRGKVVAAVMGKMLEVVVESDVSDALVVVYLGEDRVEVEVDKKRLPVGRMMRRQFGPRIALLGARGILDPDADKSKVSGTVSKK